MFAKLKELILGKSQDPFSSEHRRHLVLIAFLAWVGLGADGLSSACYGPELGYLSLGQYHNLALFLASLTAITVFIIALGYNQVIALFPNGGGGYKVANTLLGPTAGVISGTALIIDYMLTIAISVASGVEAILSLLPAEYANHKILIEVVLVLFLMYLNLRGMKESIKFLLPIFLGFVVSHLAIIVYGVFMQEGQVPNMFHHTFKETHEAIGNIGLIAMIAIVLRAYSLGSGTYTGLEAVSNNVNVLAEPRVKTGIMTMIYMAISLSVVASGIILLYLLWQVEPVTGMTLNAVVFQQILGPGYVGHILLIILLACEAGILLVGANTGYLGGPAVLANMAIDDWVPRRFSNLSSRLVKQDGVLFFGICAASIIILTEGSIGALVIVYSINVFITFSISLFGLSVYWWQNRQKERVWLRHLILSVVGFVVCAFILSVTIVTKFYSGSLIAVLFTLFLVMLCMFLKKYYKRYEKLKSDLDKALEFPLEEFDRKTVSPKLDPQLPTAVFLVKEIGSAMHTILWVERMFPKYFKNYIFMAYGQVDMGSFGSDTALKRLKKRTERLQNYLIRFAKQNGIAAKGIVDFGANPMTAIPAMAEKVNEAFPQNVYFTAKYIYMKENLLTKLIHSDFVDHIQNQLQNIGTKMLTVPLKLEKPAKP